MRRYWIHLSHDQECAVGKVLHLFDETFHHIVDVCRHQEGDGFEILLGDHKAYFCRLKQIQKKSCDIEILEERMTPQLKAPLIHLAVSLPKLATFETILEKAVELGVYQVTPILSDFSFLRSVDLITENKWRRWEKIIESACQQSGRGQKMQLHQPAQLGQFVESFNRNGDALGLFAYEGEGQMAIKPYLRQTRLSPQQVVLFIGSEGGFSQAEVQHFKEKGLAPVTLGEQVLRVETACLALVSVIKYEFNLMQ